MVKIDKNKKIVLVAEDEKPYCRALVLKLTNAGFDAVGVENGVQAIEMLKKQKFDLLILDLVMPKMNGFSVLEEMEKGSIKLPVIVLSNLTQEEDKKKIESFGVKSFIEKSETPIAEVITKVEKFIE